MCFWDEPDLFGAHTGFQIICNCSKSVLVRMGIVVVGDVDPVDVLIFINPIMLTINISFLDKDSNHLNL